MSRKRRTDQLTIETALWVLIAVAALALRLAHLDAAPLGVHEAREATFAWRAATGQGMPETGYSPLLFTVNALLFALCGASDGLARLWPALCGSGLALAPFLLRQRVGRVGALAAGVYFAFSPTLLFASRQLDGAVVAALGGLVFLGGLVRFFEPGVEPDAGAGKDGARRVWLTLSAAGLALAVTSSSSAYGLLLALSLAWLSLVWVWPGADKKWALLSPHLGHILAVFLLTGLAFSTGLGWNMAGLGAVGDLLPAWTARFTPVSDGVASPFTFLAVYELLALLFGLGGLVWAVLRGHRFGVALGVWAGAGILLLLLMPGKTGLDTLWGLLPLALLTGIAIEQLAQGLGERGDWLSEGLHIPVVILLWIRLYLALASYAVSGNSADLALVLLVLALQALLSVIFALGLSTGAALRSAAVGTGVVLLAMMISAGWGVAYVRPSDPREPLVSEPTAVEVRDLVGTLHDLSWQRTGLPQTLEFTLEAAPDSVLAWYLRDFAAYHRIESLGARGGEEIADVLVSTRLDPVGLSAEYVGQSFTLHRSWDSATIACIMDWPPQCHSAVGWWLFRDSSAVPVSAVDQQAVLWVQVQD